MSEWIVYSKDGLTERCSVKSLEYNGEWMGKCNVSVTISSPSPIDFEIGDFLEYRGERFEINYDPSVIKQSSRETYGEGFKYENVIFNSLSDELTRCDFLDYVPSDNQIHYTSLPTFSFFADNIGKLAERIQTNLDRVYKGSQKWTIVVHNEYVNKTNVNITANNITCWDALALVKTEFDANFVIKGRTITIGTEGIAINKLFSYGKGNGLVSIERNAESEQKIITRLRAYGSTKNMPESYYKNLGMKVFFTIGEYSTFEQSVSFYIKTKYNSLNMFTTEWQEQSVGSYTPYKIKVRLNEVAVTAMVALNEGDIDSYINVSSTYEKDSTNLDQFMSDLRSNRYSKLYVESGVVQTAFPYEEREYLDNLPNNMAVRNLMLPSFPENQDPYIDSDNIEMLGVREATVFFDGANGLEEIYPTLPSENGINQINSAEQIADDGVYAEGSEIPTFEIYLNDLGFDINDHKSTAGNPIVAMKDGMCGGREFEVQAVESYGTGYKLTCNRSYDDALDLYFPYNGYQIKSGDTFTLLNIAMPDEYVQAASERLLKAAKEYLAKNDYVRYSYIPKVDNVILARQHDEATANGERSIHDTIKEGDLMLFEDDDLRIEGSVIISTLSIKEGEGRIPQYEITLNNEKAVGTFEKIQNQIDSIVSGSTSVKGEGGYNSSQINSMIEVYGSKKFLRKDKDDRSKGKISSDKGFEVGKFEQGTLGTGASMYKGEDENTYIEADFLKIRKKATFTTITVQELKHVGGEIILSHAAMICSKVEETELGYKCYFNTEDSDGRKIYNEFEVGDFARCQTFNLEHNKYYWRYVSEVGKDYIVLSKFDCDSNSDIPEAGDNISQLGNRYDEERQNAIVLSAYGEDAPSYKQYNGINEYALSEGMLVTKLSTKGNVLKGDFISQSTGKNIEQEFKELGVDIDIVKSQVDKEFTIWFFDYEPTLENYPASEWVTEELLIMHEQDIFYNRESGRAYRFISGSWIEITDADTLRAIEKADNAQQSANNAQQSADNAQQSANNAQQSADNAQQSANNAQQSADNAQQSANEAKQKAEAITLVVEEVISDGVLSSLEKKNVLRDFESIMAEYNRNMSSLTIFGLTNEDATVSKYHNSYISLGTYMNGGIPWDGNSIPSWLTNISVNQPINSSEYRAYWSSYTDSYVEFMSYLSEIAKNKADNANKRIDEIVSDGILSALEKKEVLKEWEEVSSSYSINLTNALKYGISIDSYQTAYLALGAYLNGGSWDGSSTPKWLVEDKNQPIDSATYRSVWIAYYNEEKDLLNSISDAINKNASSKRRVFTSQPTNDSVYDVGDLWVNATYSDENVSYNDDMLVCITSKLKGEPFSINHWRPSTGVTKSYIERIEDSITLAVTNSSKGIEEAKKAAEDAAKAAADAANDALNALGVANTANDKADLNTSAIQVLDNRITAVVQGITYDENGDIKNLSALVLENSFASLFNEKIQLDTDGNVLNINTAGLVTATGDDDTSFASLFAKSVNADGNIVKQAQITSFVTYSELGDPYSGVVVAADNINFYGKTVINGKFIVDANGNITMNDFTANNGVFNGEINAEKGTITGNLTVGSGSVPLVIQPSNSDGYPSLVWNSSSQTYLSVGVYYSGGYAAGQIFAANNNGESSAIYPNDIHVIGASRRTYIQGGLLSFDGVTIQKDASGILQIYASKWPVENNNKTNYMYVDGDGYVKVKNPTRG